LLLKKLGGARQTLTHEESSQLKAAGVFLHEDDRKGTWGDSELEKLLRAILKYAKGKAPAEVKKFIYKQGSLRNPYRNIDGNCQSPNVNSTK